MHSVSPDVHEPRHDKRDSIHDTREVLHNELPRIDWKVELLNALTHGIGVVLGIVFLVMLLITEVHHQRPIGIVAFAIYGGCFIFLFLASTVYHSVPAPKVKSILRIFDHVAIFLFIAGSFTPPILLLMTGLERILLLSVIWVIAVGGTVFKAVTFRSYDRLKGVSTFLYICMGWLGIFLVRLLLTERPWPLFALILLGGILYSVGTVFYRMKKWKYHHVIWHLFVLAAAVAHFIGYYFYL